MTYAAVSHAQTVEDVFKFLNRPALSVDAKELDIGATGAKGVIHFNLLVAQFDYFVLI